MDEATIKIIFQASPQVGSAFARKMTTDLMRRGVSAQASTSLAPKDVRSDFTIAGEVVVQILHHAALAIVADYLKSLVLREETLKISIENVNTGKEIVVDASTKDVSQSLSHLAGSNTNETNRES